MARKSRKKSANAATAEDKITSLTIEEQTQAFLESGGEIQKIDKGVSGQTSLSGQRHITLGNNR